MIVIVAIAFTHLLPLFLEQPQVAGHLVVVAAGCRDLQVELFVFGRVRQRYIAFLDQLEVFVGEALRIPIHPSIRPSIETRK